MILTHNLSIVHVLQDRLISMNSILVLRCEVHYIVDFLIRWLCQKCQSGSGVTLEWKGVDNKSGEQPWPQLMCCASIFCHVCGCVFQEDWIVARSSGKEWYRLIGVRIEVSTAKVWWLELSQLSLCSAFDKENSIESPLDFATLYIQLLLWLYTLSPTVLMPVSWLLCHMLWLWHDHSVTSVTPFVTL